MSGTVLAVLQTTAVGVAITAAVYVRTQQLHAGISVGEKIAIASGMLVLYFVFRIANRALDISA